MFFRMQQWNFAKVKRQTMEVTARRKKRRRRRMTAEKETRDEFLCLFHQPEIHLPMFCVLSRSLFYLTRLECSHLLPSRKPNSKGVSWRWLWLTNTGFLNFVDSIVVDLNSCDRRGDNDSGDSDNFFLMFIFLSGNFHSTRLFFFLRCCFLLFSSSARLNWRKNFSFFRFHCLRFFITQNFVAEIFWTFFDLSRSYAILKHSRSSAKFLNFPTWITTVR